MTKISKITTQKRNKNRYNIFIDDGQGESYGFSVEEDVLIEFHLQKGMELTQDLIRTLMQKDNLHKSFTLAINYLSYRMRSEKEIRDYLAKKEVDEEKINLVVDKLKEEGYLHDGEFAQALVNTRINTTNKGPRLVQRELIEKGVDKATAEQALTDYEPEVQLEKAMKLIEKKNKTSSKKSHKQHIQYLKQTLMQKGFNSDTIQEAINQSELEEDTDEEWEAVVFQGEKLLRKYQRKDAGKGIKQKIKAGLYQKGFNFELIDRFIEEYVEET